jgi:hypothetical protein
LNGVIERLLGYPKGMGFRGCERMSRSLTDVYKRVTVRLVVGWMASCAAVTVTTELVEAAVAFTTELDVAPQPVHIEAINAAANAIGSIRKALRFLLPNQQNPTSPIPAEAGPPPDELPELLSGGAVIVNAAWTGVPSAVTVLGEKPQVAPAGRPEHVSDTEPANPFSGMTDKFVELACPGATVTELLASLMEKVGADDLIV